ncbi:adaptor protein MecA [Lacticaseibacillus brantae]|uniref:Adapter protein MecA n=1 Tax=Lacticaseibacillus brantae DSM 23927 TaxID=1423727 RepID=A0A0R2B8L9_9LACO|nr:adaptor protein MecA [Lacticaseibacillus brantae]KRM72470.1 adapter protein mecA [Lacticaseibacillus brantae DSM 23927]
MEMERINDDTIRVLLGNDDLTARGITVLDLLGNHKQIESFFYSILDEVDKDHTFATNDAVTFQVMPSQSGLELLISKNNFKDENQDQSDNEDIEPTFLAAGDDVPNFIKEQLQGLDQDEDDDQAYDAGDYVEPGNSGQRNVVIKMASFEDLISLAKVLRLEGGTSDLYQYKGDYYLSLTFFDNAISMQEANDEIAIAMEYGDKATISDDVLSEYGQRIMATSALETVRYYFK